MPIMMFRFSTNFTELTKLDFELSETILAPSTSILQQKAFPGVPYSFIERCVIEKHILVTNDEKNDDIINLSEVLVKSS